MALGITGYSVFPGNDALSAQSKIATRAFSKISIRVRWHAMNYNFMVYCCSWKHYVKVLVAALLILQTLLNYKLLKSKASPSRGRELLDYSVDGMQCPYFIT